MNILDRHLTRTNVVGWTRRMNIVDLIVDFKRTEIVGRMLLAQ
jgi:hypothetical protein